MKTLPTLILSIAVFAISSCDNDNDPTNNVCDSTYVSTLITTAFTTANGYDDITTMDLETHEYTIQINANGEICTVGYQNPTTYTGGYTIEITNTTTSATYSGIHTFSQTTLDYQSITPVPVASGDIITVKRTILPGYTVLNQTVGRILRKNNFTTVPYPITQGNAVFLSSNFYGAGGPVPDYAQPYIALGFKVI
ncbi:hypothetical protein [Flavobacterium hydatis]|uniref:Lipoprotein n=1 Tax=Flavobacterium hydatis TaxID=991 RepID=A0A086AIA7_FLAHY|nr:hypothetical protein [Flavobacterium hydatis]KFF16421.1 hypothetical protein IW20_11790 [Flavobacterium hydatis]OXA96563.1 hypothetical protein B0A62_04685 [Flavobacterium hydatis]